MGAAGRRTTVYIDGYNLYYGRLRNTPYKWLDIVSLSAHILRIQDSDAVLNSVKYFTAPALATFASHGQDSVIAQQRYHRAILQRHPGLLSVIYGTYSFDKSGTLLPTYVDGQPFDRTSRTRVWKLEEKKTDVNLAMEMYRDAAKGRLDQIVIFSNDSDAEPALQAIREDFPDVVVGVVTPIAPPAGDGRGHRSISTSLSNHADWTRKYILDEELRDAQLPQRVPTLKKPIDKPNHW